MSGLNLIQKYSWKEVVLVGKEFEGLEIPYQFFENTAEAKEWFKKRSYKDCTILIKGSRSMAMEKVIAD